MSASLLSIISTAFCWRTDLKSIERSRILSAKACLQHLREQIESGHADGGRYWVRALGLNRFDNLRNCDASDTVTDSRISAGASRQLRLPYSSCRGSGFVDSVSSDWRSLIAKSESNCSPMSEIAAYDSYNASHKQWPLLGRESTTPCIHLGSILTGTRVAISAPRPKHGWQQSDWGLALD